MIGEINEAPSKPQAPSKRVDDKVYAYEGNEEVLRWVPKTARTALDLGCGAGGNARELSNRGCLVDGITLSEGEAEVARQVCERVFVRNLEQGLPSDTKEHYDVVIASHVLEHICFPEKLLSDVRDRMNADSILIVALPNLLYWRNRLDLFAGRFVYEEGGLMDNTHFRWYTFKTAAELFVRHGFRLERSYATGWMPQPLLRKLLPGVAGRLDSSASSMFPGLFGYQMIYVARKDHA
jgi:2-polyprenyl-3-methyl-5-hydroxy-6-metoxy-1,4-benzoquinol methylase